MIKRGMNGEALHFMDNELKELYGELQNIINIEPDNDGSKVGHLR